MYKKLLLSFLCFRALNRIYCQFIIFGLFLFCCQLIHATEDYKWLLEKNNESTLQLNNLLEKKRNHPEMVLRLEISSSPQNVADSSIVAWFPTSESSVKHQDIIEVKCDFLNYIPGYVKYENVEISIMRHLDLCVNYLSQVKFDEIVINYHDYNQIISENALENLSRSLLRTEGKFKIINKHERLTMETLKAKLITLKQNTQKNIILIIGRPNFDPVDEQKYTNNVYVYNTVEHIGHPKFDGYHIPYDLSKEQDFDYKFDEILVDWSTVQFIAPGWNDSLNKILGKNLKTGGCLTLPNDLPVQMSALDGKPPTFKDPLETIYQMFQRKEKEFTEHYPPIDPQYRKNLLNMRQVYYTTLTGYNRF